VNPLIPERWSQTGISLYRAVVGLLFTCHGISTLFDTLGNHYGRTSFMEWPSWWAAAIQLAGGALVTVGLLTRPAALLCSGSMAYAYFSVHQEKALWPIENGGEASVMFCWSFLLIAIVGSGSIALDRLLLDRRQPVVAAPATAGAHEPALHK
jgi:putative oxidoreductase